MLRSGDTRHTARNESSGPCGTGSEPQGSEVRRQTSDAARLAGTAMGGAMNALTTHDDGNRHVDWDPSQAEPAARHAVDEVVAGAVIPRLLLSCRSNGATRRPTAAHVDTLARLALSRDPAAAGAQVSALAQSGISLDSLLYDLIAPAACRLGEYWHADSVDFVEVTLATGRLIAIVRALGLEAERDTAPDAPYAVIGTPGAERHGLGSLIVAQSFRGAGWRVSEVPGAEPDKLLAVVARHRVELVGLSVGSTAAAEEVRTLIPRIRRRTRNRKLLIALGGPALVSDPDSLADAGADILAADGREAVMKARQLLRNVSGMEQVP